MIQWYDPVKTIAIADSKHDFPVLHHVDYPIIVSEQKKKWMEKLEKEYMIVTI